MYIFWYDINFTHLRNMALGTEWWVASEQSFLPLIFTMWSQVLFTAHHSNQKHKVNLFFANIQTSLNPCLSGLTSQTPLLCRITLFWSNFMNEDLKCRDVFCQKWLVASGCWIIHNYSLFYPESWARWQPVGSQQTLAADVHSQKLCRYPGLWMVVSLSGKVRRSMEGALSLPALHESLWGEDRSNWMDHTGDISKEFLNFWRI